MWNRIEEILEGFRKEFSYKSAYKWLIILVTGFMIRADKLGVTSVVRNLALRPESYRSMMRFFRASSWSLASLQTAWLGIVARQAPLWRYRGRGVLIGDGTKQAKEGRKMPGVKRLRQESETQSKASCIYGHFWGCVGILNGFENDSRHCGAKRQTAREGHGQSFRAVFHSPALTRRVRQTDAAGVSK